MGAVKFPHAAHLKVAGKCEVCHHASNSAKPLKLPQQACTDCHTKPPTPPVTTGLQAAFHNPKATAGLCITCHNTENSHGKAAPVKCADCHRKKIPRTSACSTGLHGHSCVVEHLRVELV